MQIGANLSIGNPALAKPAGGGGGGDGIGAHSKWRIYITANNGDGNFTVADGIQLYDLDDVEIDLTGSTAFADSNDGLTNAGMAFGAYNGGSNYWQSNSAGTFPRYIGIFLAAPAEIGSFKLSFCRDAGRMPKTFKLQYSDDSTNGSDGTWIDCPDGFYPDQTGWNGTLPPVDIRTFTVTQ